MPNGNDVSQEVILSFLELDQEKQRQIIEGGYLEFWAIRAAMFTNSNTGKFGKYFSRHFEDLKQIENRNKIDIHDRIDAKILLEKVTKELDAMYWYDRELFRIYLEEGSLRKVEKATGIQFTSVKTTVDKVRKKIKQKCG